jgi:hypothetical protein
MGTEKNGIILPIMLAVVSISGSMEANAMIKTLTAFRTTPVVVSRSRKMNSAKVMWVVAIMLLVT